MPKEASIFSAFAARLNDADLIEAWLLIPDNGQSPFDVAVAAELGRRYLARTAKDHPSDREKESTARLYAGW